MAASEIQKAYQNLLGRSAKQSAIDYWTNDLANGQSMEDVRKSIMSSSEFKNRASTRLNSMYNELLGRDAKSKGLDYWYGDLVKGHSWNDIRNSIMNSQEYKSRSGQQPTTGGGVSGQSPAGGGGSSQVPAPAPSPSPSVTESDINQLYRQYLGRDARQSGLNYYMNDVRNGHSLDDIRRSIQSSDEYKNRLNSGGGDSGNPAPEGDGSPQDNPYYDDLNAIYNDLLGRDIKTTGLNYWTNDLNNGYSLDDVRSNITKSDEFRNRLDRDGIEPPAQVTIPQEKTVSGLLDSILSSDSPLMQRAATQGRQLANSRGLLNSSMAAGAAQGAMIDRALPIAQQDSQTYAAIQQFNAGQKNAFRQQANSFRYDLDRMAKEYGFRSDLSMQQAQEALQKLFASSNANAWGVMANNITDLVGQASAQIERIQMNPDIEEADKASLIEQVLANRDQDIAFQQALYQSLAADLINTGLFPDNTGSISLTNQIVSAYRQAGVEPDQAGVEYWKNDIESGNSTLDGLRFELDPIVRAFRKANKSPDRQLVSQWRDKLRSGEATMADLEQQLAA